MICFEFDNLIRKPKSYTNKCLHIYINITLLLLSNVEYEWTQLVEQVVRMDGVGSQFETDVTRLVIGRRAG